MINFCFNDYFFIDNVVLLPYFNYRKRRSALAPHTVNMLVCLRDWRCWHWALKTVATRNACNFEVPALRFDKLENVW